MQKASSEDILICLNCGFRYNIRYKKINFCPNCGKKIHHLDKQRSEKEKI